MSKRCAARDSEHPRPKQVCLAQPADLLGEDDQDVLGNIVGVFRTDEAPHVSAQGRLHAAQQVLESLAIVALSQQHPVRLGLGSIQSTPSIGRRLASCKQFEWEGKEYRGSVYAVPVGCERRMANSVLARVQWSHNIGAARRPQRPLDRGEHGPTYGLRQFNGREVGRRVQVVVT